MYSIQKEYRKSIEYYEKVLGNIGNSNDSIRGNILPKLGGEYLQFNDYDKAAKYLLQGLALNRKSQNKLGLTIALNNLGELNLRQKKLILAENQLMKLVHLLNPSIINLSFSDIMV